jgi:glycine/D-amino acid oxidase-like deaminating enzyme
MEANNRITTDIVIVGAGIVGASIAYHSARAGASVTLIDKALPGSGATSASFAWIGKPTSVDRADASTPLRRLALEDWVRLADEVPGITISWTGSIVWSDDVMAQYGGASAEDLLNADQIAALEPELKVIPVRAQHNAADGAVDPVAVTDALGRSAQDHGAEVLTGVAVYALDVTDGKVKGLHTSMGYVGAETVIVASGADAPLLLRSWGVDLPVHPSPALLSRFVASKHLVRTILYGDTIEVRQTPDLLLVPSEFDGESSHADLAKTGARIRNDIVEAFDVDASQLHWIDTRIGMRPMPHDGMPLVGRLPNLNGVYVSVMHSGVTLAPVVGRMVANELVRDVVAGELRPLRPNRTVANLD